MKIEIHHRCRDFDSYRAARTKSLFNAECGWAFDLDAELPIEDFDWKIGLVVGPSGSGKSSIGRRIFGEHAFYEPTGWPTNAPIIDAIAPEGDFNAVTAALAAVGLGDVPAWLRPYGVLSTGQRFRADLARVVAEAPAEVVIDEFTSVVDRQIARIGAQAFAKAWRRTTGQAVLLSCHYDIIDWLCPDWIYDTGARAFARRRERRRPGIELGIFETDGGYWSLFKAHYYLALPRPVAASYFVGSVEGEPVAHLAVSPKFESHYYRATRLVVMPQWQGAGVGTRFLNWVCQYHLDGRGRQGRRYRTLFHTSHPQLCAYLKRSPKWRQVSSVLYGANRRRGIGSMKRTTSRPDVGMGNCGYGGHFRAVQGFAYTGGAA